MEQYKYEIQFDSAISAGERLGDIRRALEDCSAKLTRLSHEMQKGLEGEATRLTKLADGTEKRAGEIRRAALCLVSIAEAYRKAEELAYGRFADGKGDTGGKSGSGGAGSGSGAGGADGSHGGIAGIAALAASMYGTAVGRSASSKIQAAVENLIGHLPNGVDIWDPSSTAAGNWWENLPALLKWVYISPLLLAISRFGGILMAPIWKLLIDLFKIGSGGGSQAGAQDGEQNSGADGSGEDDAYGTGAHEGAAVIDRPEDDFSDAMAGVTAEMGGAESTVDFANDGSGTGDSSEYGGAGDGSSDMSFSSGGDSDGSAFDSGSADSSSGAYETGSGSSSTGSYGGASAAGSSGDSGGSGSYGGSDGGSGGSGYSGDSGSVVGADGAGVNSGFAGAEFDDMSAMSGAGSGDSSAGADAMGGSDGFAATEASGSGSSGAGFAAATPSENTATASGSGVVESLMSDTKSSSGLAAPIIGAGAAASIAAAGVTMGSIASKGGKGSGEGEEEEQVAPVVETDRSQGVFAGDLNGNYVMLGSTVAMMFTGSSIAAGVMKNNKDKKPDDRFRTGYGVSAVLSGGPIQERE